MPREFRPDEIERRERALREPADTALTTAMRGAIGSARRRSSGTPITARTLIDAGELDTRRDCESLADEIRAEEVRQAASEPIAKDAKPKVEDDADAAEALHARIEAVRAEGANVAWVESLIGGEQ